MLNSKLLESWNVKSIKIYWGQSAYDLINLSDGALELHRAIEVKDPVLSSLFKAAKYKNAKVLLKGTTLGIVKLDDGLMKKIIISNYGGFFLLPDQPGGYYYFDNDERKVWDNILRK